MAGSTWTDAFGISDGVAALSAIAAVVIAVVRTRGNRAAWLVAAEPVLAGLALGHAMAGGGVTEHVGKGFPSWLVGIGALCLLASVLWRRPQARRPGWGLVAIVVLGSLVTFSATGSKWWGDELATDVLRWPVTGGLGIAALIALVSVVVGRFRGRGTWAALVAAVGAASLATGVAILQFASFVDNTANSGPWMALSAGLVVAAAGVSALLSPGPPPGPR